MDNPCTAEEEDFLGDPAKTGVALSSKVNMSTEVAHSIGDMHIPIQVLRRWSFLQDEAVRKINC